MRKEIISKKYWWVDFQNVKDGIDGMLTIAEIGKQIPFGIKRVYLVNKLANINAMRGMHAHKKLQQIIVCISGSFELDLYDGKNRVSVTLSSPRSGIYMGPGVWHDMRRFSRGCVIMVLASEVYKESDYIRDFRQFARFVKQKKV